MNPMKCLSGFGEGGLIATNNKKLYEKIKIQICRYNFRPKKINN